ncbi:hypothetical protein HaLaN_12913 [Haematococcus lacustris]|uniref:Uncharacterized protein n=1 Tax=Haematococcus lacustris TaxID=44745 RepID=A0A699ZBR2_HAELA|nr:hypothetical protein HaLaN_12913 [Haematococcus lacustris]
MLAKTAGKQDAGSGSLKQLVPASLGLIRLQQMKHRPDNWVILDSSLRDGVQRIYAGDDHIAQLKLILALHLVKDRSIGAAKKQTQIWQEGHIKQQLATLAKASPKGHQLGGQPNASKDSAGGGKAHVGGESPATLGQLQVLVGSGAKRRAVGQAGLKPVIAYGNASWAPGGRG